MTQFTRQQRLYLDDDPDAWVVDEADAGGVRLRRGEQTLHIRLAHPVYPAAEVINTAEAARILGITPVYLQILLRDGRVPGYRSGKRWELRRAEVEALAERSWMAKGTGRPMLFKPSGRQSTSVAQFDDQFDEAVAAYDAGDTLRDIAAQFDVSVETVRLRFKAADVKRRGSGRSRKTQDAQHVAEMIRLYSVGQTINQIAERFGVAPGTIKQRLVEAGVEIRPRAGRFDDRIAAEVRQAYEDGATLHELAERYSVSPDTVRRRLVAAGTEMRKPGEKRRASLPIVELIRLYDDGQSVSRIAERFGVAPETVRRRLVESGVKIRQRSGGIDGRIVKVRRSDESSPARHDAEMTQLYREGHSLAYIAEQFGTSVNKVKWLLVRGNVELRSAGDQARMVTRLTIPIEQLIGLYRDGYSLHQIAKQFGVSTATVRRRFVEANVERRPNTGRRRRTNEAA